MNIRAAAQKDMETIAQIYVKNWKETYPGLLAADFLDAMSVAAKTLYWTEYSRAPEQIIFLAEDSSSAVIGFVALRPDKQIARCLYLDSLHIDKAARGKGIGSSLIRFAHRYASREGYEKMSICVVRGNDQARALYEKLGAKHYEFFEDDFNGTVANSERLIWERLISCDDGDT